MGNAHPWYDCKWTVKQIRNGRVIWEQTRRNDLTNAGERNILNTYFKNIEAPTEFHVRLSRNFIGLSDTLASVVEPSGNGYAPLLVERSNVGFPTIELDEADYRIVSKIVTFTAVGGQIGPANFMFLATSSDNTGVLVAAVKLENERILEDGESLQIQFKVKLR